MPKRRHHRFVKRLETTFSSGDLKHSGISSDLSVSGLFIRSQRGFVPGTVLDITLYISEDNVSRLKGIVRRTIKTSMTTMVKNGMGVELTEIDSNYREFLKSIGIFADMPHWKHTEAPAEPAHETTEDKTHIVPEYVMLVCPSCKVKNKIPREKIQMSPRCGKCHGILSAKDIS